MTELGGYPVIICFSPRGTVKRPEPTLYGLDARFRLAAQRNDWFEAIQIKDILVRQLQKERDKNSKAGSKAGDQNRYLVYVIASNVLADCDMDWEAAVEELKQMEPVSTKMMEARIKESGRSAMKDWLPVKWRTVKQIIKEDRAVIEAHAKKIRRATIQNKLKDIPSDFKERVHEIVETYSSPQAIGSRTITAADLERMVIRELGLKSDKEIEDMKILLEVTLPERELGAL